MRPSASSVGAAQAPHLDEAGFAQFEENGYVVLPAFLPDDLVARLKAEVDRWVDEGYRSRSIACATDPATHGEPPLLEIEMEAHGELVTYPPLIAALDRIMGGDFVFHHLHSDRQAPDLAGKAWHHDYEQRPQTDRTHLMVHVMHYPDGLGEDTAGLALLPGSHREVAAKSALVSHGTDELPGEVLVDDLPRGSTVLVHSALFHARRARPEPGSRPRYFIDASYCQVGVKWPPVKPFWRQILRRGRELRLDRGRPQLFAEQHFTEYAASG